jgi:hypothetical protein
VPRRTGWHWLAVQNERVALSCLVNYGPRAHCYTQVWLDDAGPRPREWVRLEQSVSFECPGTTPACAWRVTSSDLDLDVELLQSTTGRTLIPPLVGWLVNLTHTEAFVKARGRIRVDGTWVEVDGLGGALEEHFGTW